MKELENILYFLLVSIFWGATNPLIKKYTGDIVKVKSSNWVNNFLNELLYLIRNPWCILFFCINQCGSLLFIYLLQSTEISLVVPIVNALTFLVTAVVGILTKENTPTLKTLVGISFILVGISLCMAGKVWEGH